jgi:hypothetical protein
MGKPALDQSREIVVPEPKTFTERPLLDRRHRKQAREDVGVKIAVLGDRSVDDAVPCKGPVTHRSAGGMVP